MIKLILISDKDFKGITFWFLKKVSYVKILNDVKGSEVDELIENESTDFLFLNIKKPANTDVMERLCLRNYDCLRVSVFTFRPSRFRLIRFFFPIDLIKTFVQNISARPKSA